MSIDPLPPELAQAAIDLWHECGLTRPWNDPMQDLRQAREGPSSTVLAALDGGRLIGTSMVGDDGHRGWVYYLAVRSDAQGRGVGRALMQASESWLRARGVLKLNLMVRTTNTAVLGFYQALGYLDDEVVVMSKRLDRA